MERNKNPSLGHRKNQLDRQRSRRILNDLASDTLQQRSRAPQSEKTQVTPIKDTSFHVIKSPY